MRIILSTIALFLFAISGIASAQTRETPYWATIDTEELNMRVGPSRAYKIEWVYKRNGLPVKVVRVHEGWRLIQDSEGAQGWVVARMLSAERGAIVVGVELAAIREAPADNGRLKWNAEPGVIGRLGDCELGWCVFDVGGRKGYMRAEQLWGSGEP